MELMDSYNPYVQSLQRQITKQKKEIKDLKKELAKMSKEQTNEIL